MQLLELLRRRLKISLGAVHSDPAVSDNLKSLLGVFSEIICQQTDHMEILQSEVSDRVSQYQFKQGLSLKLSVKEFLGYFQKIQKIVEKMENYWHCNQVKTNQIIDQRFHSLTQKIEEIVQGRAGQMMEQQRLEDQRMTEIDELRKNITKMRNQIQQMGRNSDKYIGQLRNNVEATKLKVDEVMQLNQKQSSISNDKLKAVVSQIKDIQLYFNQTHQQMKSLIESMISSEHQSTKTNNSTSHQATIQHIQKQLQNRLQLLNHRIDKQIVIKPTRMMWEWRPQVAKMKWIRLNGGVSEAVSEQWSHIVRNQGFYKIAMGYLLDLGLQAGMKLFVDDLVVCSIDFQEQSHSSGLCRATMLYIYLLQGSTVQMEVSGKKGVSGFIQLQHF